MTTDTLTEASLHELAAQLGQCLTEKNMKLAAAESCTGGWLAKIITDLPGSSVWFEGSIVSYSNALKHGILGVSTTILDEFGAVSSETVRAMNDGVVANTDADIAVSISGIAGPGGGSPDKPVGLVWLCWGQRGKSKQASAFHFNGDRQAVRLQSIEKALVLLLALLHYQ